jgi:hypothetical protein
MQCLLLRSEKPGVAITICPSWIHGLPPGSFVALGTPRVPWDSPRLTTFHPRPTIRADVVSPQIIFITHQIHRNTRGFFPVHALPSSRGVGSFEGSDSCVHRRSAAGMLIRIHVHSLVRSLISKIIQQSKISRCVTISTERQGFPVESSMKQRPMRASRNIFGSGIPVFRKLQVDSKLEPLTHVQLFVDGLNFRAHCCSWVMCSWFPEQPKISLVIRPVDCHKHPGLLSGSSTPIVPYLQQDRSVLCLSSNPLTGLCSAKRMTGTEKVMSSNLFTFTSSLLSIRDGKRIFRPIINLMQDRSNFLM